MTIASHVRHLNERLSNLETCADRAPEDTYDRSKMAVEAVHEAADAILAAFRLNGFKALNDDRLRNIEAALYGYLLESNPEEVELIAGEGFGEHVSGPAGRRVMQQAIADRDFLQSLRA